MPVLQHLEKLNEGVDAWNKWREQAQASMLNLSGADLKGRKLRGVHFNFVGLAGSDLREADLSFASLSGAILPGAKLNSAHLVRADFRGANCEGANFANAQFSDTNLEGANLKSASLFAAFLAETTFSRTDLRGADFTHARLARCVFADVDLSETLGLDAAIYFPPSTVGVDTIYRSRGKIPRNFLRGTAVSEQFLGKVWSLVSSGFHRCFMSYSSRDEPFPAQLYDRLWANGVQCFKFSEDAKGGAPVWEEISQRIQENDKVLLICSENSLRSGPVLRELERALAREDSEGKTILFPVYIDRYLFDRWNHHRKPDVLRTTARSFCGWQDWASFDKSLAQLVADLRTDT